MVAPGGGPPSVEVDGCTWERTMVQTHLIHIKEPLEPLLDAQVRPLLREGDFVAMSEKVVAISEGRVVHESVVRPGLLAKLIVKGTKKYEHDVAYSDPRKMQVAIMQTGSARAAFAMVVGGVTKLFGRHGDFYRIAGHRIAEIDGFNPDTIAPFNEFAMLGPADPDKACASYRALARPPRGDHRREQHQRGSARDECGHAGGQGGSPAHPARQPDGSRR